MVPPLFDDTTSSGAQGQDRQANADYSKQESSVYAICSCLGFAFVKLHGLFVLEDFRCLLEVPSPSRKFINFYFEYFEIIFESHP